MLTNAKTIKGYKLSGIDGEVGKIQDFLFDDQFWTVRYLVASTGGLFNRKQVLISPYFLYSVDHNLEIINVNLSKDEIENSPLLESEMPVSRQYEEEYYGYYGAPNYWSGPSMWGSSGSIPRERDKWNTTSNQEKSWEPNLRNSKDVTSYNIQSTDGEIGHVDDFIIDEDNWAIRYMIIDTKNWLPGKKVLISPQWIERISWDESKVFVSLSHSAIEKAPEFDDDQMLTRDYESNLHQYYNRQGYWTEEPVYGDYSRSVIR